VQVRRRTYFRLLVLVTVLILITIFALQNAVIVSLHLFVWEIEMSRALLVFVLLLIGTVTGWILRGHYRKPEK